MLIISFILGTCLILGSLVFTQTSPKELILKQITESDFTIDQSLYAKSSQNVNVQVTRLEGSLITKSRELTQFKDSYLIFDTSFDPEAQKASINFCLGTQHNNYDGRIMIDNDKIILTKSIFTMINDLSPQSDLSYFLHTFPEYLFLNAPQIAKAWANSDNYNEKEVINETKDLMLFTLEAIPEKYFNLSLQGITIQLDQQGLEETIYNFLEKIKNEKERFADIICGFYKMSAAHLDQNIGELREEIISDLERSIEYNEFPSNEEISTLANYLEVKDLSYTSSLIPGGKKALTMALDFKETNDITGNINFNSEFSGSNILKGSYNLHFDLNSPDGYNIKGAINCPFSYLGTSSNSSNTINLTVSNLLTSGTMLDMEIITDSNTQVDNTLTVDIPTLTPENSMNLQDGIY